MIDLLALFTGQGAEARPGKAAAPGEGRGLFAALIAALKSGGGAEGEALPKGTPGLIGKMTALIEGAERALAQPDLSDAEIGDVLDRLVADLATLIAAQPKLAAQVTGALELLADPAAGAEVPQRILAEALPALRGAVQAVLTESAGQGPETPGLAPLLGRIVQAVEAVQQGGAAQAAPLMFGGRIAPVVAGTPTPAGGVSTAPAAAASVPAPDPAATGTGEAVPAKQTLQAAAPTPAPAGPGQPVPTETARALAAESPSNALTQTTSTAATVPNPATPPTAHVGPPAIPAAEALAPAGTPIADVPLPTGAAPASPVAQAQGVAQAMPAPPAPPLPVEQREVLGQLRAQVGEQGRIRVELRPDGLGAVEIDLAPDEAGQLRVVVRAESAAILGMLRGDREGLLALLRDAGHDVKDGAMSFGDLGQNRDGGRDPARPGWSPVLGAAADPGAEESQPQGPVPAAGGVDMRV